MPQNVTHSKLEAAVGARIKQARNDKHLTIAQVARHLNVDPRTVARWQAGGALPRYWKFVELAELLGRPYAWFYEDAPTVNGNAADHPGQGQVDGVTTNGG